MHIREYRKKGKWATELQQTQNMLVTVENLYTDIGSFAGKNPEKIISALQKKLVRLKQTFKQSGISHSFLDDRLIKINQNIQAIETLSEKIIKATTTISPVAKEMTQQFMQTIKRPMDYYQQKYHQEQKRQPLKTTPTCTSYLFSKKAAYGVFERSAAPHQETWPQICAQLQEFAQIADHKHTEHHVLSVLFESDNELFIKALQSGTVAIGEEIGFLALQRLKDIYARETKPRLRTQALALIYNATFMPENLFRCKSRALEQEIIKLALHAILHPDKKLVWLGTTRAVEAMIKKYPGEAIYFNPASQHFSWSLDRAWLQAAVYFGYEFKLIEQHFPNIEKSILSGNTAHFVAQLARQIRNPRHHSQYHGGSSPTATTQEILVLLEMGCTAVKNKDNSISLIPRKTAWELPEPSQRLGNLNGQRRSHSCPALFRAAPLPPLSQPQEHFDRPMVSIARKSV